MARGTSRRVCQLSNSVAAALGCAARETRRSEPIAPSRHRGARLMTGRESGRVAARALSLARSLSSSLARARVLSPSLSVVFAVHQRGGCRLFVEDIGRCSD